jgi:hypothetical protein
MADRFTSGGLNIGMVTGLSVGIGALVGVGFGGATGRWDLMWLWIGIGGVIAWAF